MTTVDRIDAILKDRRMSRRQLAICANIPPSSLQSAMERNKPLSFEMQQKISRALEVSVFEVLGDEERELFVEAEAGTLSHYLKKGYKFTTEEKLLVRLFHLLNETGKNAAIDRVGDLTEIPRYRRQEPQEAAPPASEGKDTTPAEPPPESQENGE